MALRALGTKTPVPSHPSKARLETFPNPKDGEKNRDLVLAAISQAISALKD